MSHPSPITWMPQKVPFQFISFAFFFYCNISSSFFFFQSSFSLFRLFFCSSSISTASLCSVNMFPRDSMWACVGLLACTDVYEAYGLPTLVEWTLSATCITAPCVYHLAIPCLKVYFIRGRGFGRLLHYLVWLFIFYWCSTVRVERDKAHYVCPVYALCMRIHDVWAPSQIKSSVKAMGAYLPKAARAFFF